MPQNVTPIAGILLAAGGSRRMGRPKMLLRLEGETLIRRAARRALAAHLSPLIVVVGHEAERMRAELHPLPLDVVMNEDFVGPTSASLHTGLRQLPADVAAVSVMLADMALVTEQMLASMTDALRRSDALLVASRYGGIVAPPFLFRRELFGELLAGSGEGVGKAVVEHHRDRGLLLDWPAESITDVDTPADLDKVRALLRQTPRHPP